MSLKGGSAADVGRTVARGYIDPGGFIVRTGLEVLSGINKDRAPNKRQEAALLAAGFEPPDPNVKGRRSAPLGWTTPDGDVISRDEARRVARALPVPLPTPPLVPAPAPLPTGGDILEDLLKRPSGRIGTGPLPRTDELGRELLDDLLKRPRTPAPAPTPADAVGKLPKRLPAILGRVGGIIGGVLWPSDLGDSDLDLPPLPETAPARPPPEPPRVTIPEEPLPAPVETWPSPTPRPVDEFPPAQPPTRSPDPLPVVLLPVPDAAERPRPRPDPTPTAAPAPSPASVPFDFPSLFPFPLQLPLPKRPPASIRLPRLTSNPLLALVPGAQAAPLPRGLTQVQPATLASAGPPSGSSRCSCPPKRPRKPKKQREECFEGFYREKRSGIQKTPRRRVPCQ